MKALLYALVLLAVLVGSLILLRSIDSSRTPRLDRGDRHPVVSSKSPRDSDIDPANMTDATADELLATGDELLSLWHVREAADVFEQAIVLDNTYAPAYAKLVECYSHPIVGLEDQARESWAAMSAAVSNDDDSFLNGLKNLYIDRDYDGAIGDLSNVVRASPDQVDARYKLALALVRAGRFDEAQVHLDAMIEADETNGRVMELSIHCAVARDDLENAENQARDLARIYSEEPHPYVLLAQVEMLRGSVDEAAEFCNNALILDPGYIPAILTRANLYALTGEMQAARVSFEKLLLFDDHILRATGAEGVAYVDFLSGRFDDGVASMDEAIRHAMLGGAVRRGLGYAFRLVDYLCELGQSDAASDVVKRWVTGFGDIPVSLSNLRIRILNGVTDSERKDLIQMRTDNDWMVWMVALSVDPTELSALAYISEEDHAQALDVLDKAKQAGASVTARRVFLRGYANFESGDAESARQAFARVGNYLYTVEFPYRGDPVLFVQSLFYMAETSIATGDAESARSHYQAFLSYWADAEWELHAVQRAVEKLAAFTE